MVVFILLFLVSPLLGIESEYIRLDNQLQYYVKLLEGGRNYEISCFARHGEYFEAFIITTSVYDDEWYDERESKPPAEEFSQFNETDNDIIFNHKSRSDHYCVIYRGKSSKGKEVNLEMHLYTSIALEYYWEIIVLIVFAVLCCCFITICLFICLVAFLVYMRCCESTVRNCLWDQCKILHRKSAEAKRANALRKRLDRIKENQRLLPENPDEMNVSHELREIQPDIEVETSARLRKFKEPSSDEEESTSSSEDEGVKIAIIQEKTKPKPKPKPKPKVEPKPKPVVQQQPQNIQIHVALPQGQNPMMFPGSPMLMGHQPMMIGPDGKPVAMGGMIPQGGMMPQGAMMPQMMNNPMMFNPNQTFMPNIQLNTQQQQQQPNMVPQSPVPVSPVPVATPTVTKIKKDEKQQQPSPISSVGSEMDISGELDLDGDEVDIIAMLEDQYQKKKKGGELSSDDSNSDESSSGSD